MRRALMLPCATMLLLCHSPTAARRRGLIPDVAGTAWSETLSGTVTSFLGKEPVFLPDMPLSFLDEGETAAAIANGRELGGFFLQRGKRVDIALSATAENAMATTWEELFFDTFGVPATFILKRFRRTYRIVNRRGTLLLEGKVKIKAFLVSSIGTTAVKVKLRSIAVQE